MSPLYPRLMPNTLNPATIAALVTARIAAFIPGASPPEVRIPTAFCLLMTLWFCVIVLDIEFSQERVFTKLRILSVVTKKMVNFAIEGSMLQLNLHQMKQK